MDAGGSDADRHDIDGCRTQRRVEPRLRLPRRGRLRVVPGAVARRRSDSARLGRAAAARRDAAAVLAAEPTAYRKYQMAGLHAQLARHDPRGPDRREALRLLALALRAGFEDMALLKRDADLDPIRNDPEFKRLLTAVGQVAPAGR